MEMKKLLRYCAPLALVASGAAQATTIDLFDDPNPGSQTVFDTGLNGNGGTFSQAGPFASILGGYRDLYIEKLLGATDDPDVRATLRVGSNGVGDRSLQWSHDVGVQSYAAIQWDGNDNSPSLDATVGLGGIDLSGDNAFVYKILESDLGFTFRLGAYTSATQFTEITLIAAQVVSGAPVTETIAFAFFSNPFFCAAANVKCGADDASPVDFSSITALQVELLSGGINNLDLQLDFAETIPEPTSLALIGASLLAAGGVTRRRAKKV